MHLAAPILVFAALIFLFRWMIAGRLSSGIVAMLGGLLLAAFLLLTRNFMLTFLMSLAGSFLIAIFTRT